MPTTGYAGFRYNGRFYRGYLAHDAHVSDVGETIARGIPRDAGIRERWIHYIKKRLAAGIGKRRGGDWQDDWDSSSDEDFPNGSRDDYWDRTWGGLYEKPRFSDIVEDNMWITFEYNCDHTYIIDLDNRAFTIGGVVHFNLDNMPPLDAGISDYYYHSDTIPAEYLTTVSYWPKSSLDVDSVRAQYDAYHPAIMTLSEWGAPTWDTLSVSQSLSLDLAKSIIFDFRTVLANPSLMINFGKVIMLCWRIVCAAAPSHLFCPARNAESIEEVEHTDTRMSKFGRIDGEPMLTSADIDRLFLPRFQIDLKYRRKPLARPYYWFRGCLFKFCLRLDEETHVKAEVVQIADRLKKGGKVGAIGVLMSSNQLVALVVDDADVRTSPVLEFQNNKGGVADGLLLLVHLLSPAMTVHKTPWINTRSIPQHSSSSSLPEDVLRHIMRFADNETYQFALPYVSILVRSLCLARPRVGDYTFTAVNVDGSYQVLPAVGPTSEIRARLVRKQRRAMKTLEYSFLTHQTGTAREANDYMAKRRELDETYGMTVPWNALVAGNVTPSMRVLVVDGTWVVEKVLE
ncbi:hypothetical protein RhiJN_27628 [Ceratobasidium sp. AG-Ba]|nr:hypothetical protein RhiJN_13578 [Ceratobasidium sp. AG-Ba]QRV99609.1 hypothetical protein RhiJN_27628 [Ceratobasidium sp. AG-Ba]QRW14140.1 hypothetical protein RhiLY_13139 [Ceratobasidium sp. AG-Ba]